LSRVCRYVAHVGSFGCASRCEEAFSAELHALSSPRFGVTIATSAALGTALSQWTEHPLFTLPTLRN